MLVYYKGEQYLFNLGIPQCLFREYREKNPDEYVCIKKISDDCKTSKNVKLKDLKLISELN